MEETDNYKEVEGYNGSEESPNKGISSSPKDDENYNNQLSRSKLQYEQDEEDYELRKKLLESKMARKKTEEDTKILMNRLLLLKSEEQKVNCRKILGLEKD